MNMVDYFATKETSNFDDFETSVTNEFTIFKKKNPENFTKNCSDDSIKINSQTRAFYKYSPNKNLPTTPLTSIGKKFITSLKNNNHSKADFFQNGFRNLGNQKDKLFNKKYSSQIPTPLNLSSTDVPLNNNHIHDHINEDSLISNRINLEPQLLKLALEDSCVTDIHHQPLNKSYKKKNSTSPQSRKNFKNETCAICKELLRISLAEKKPIFLKAGGLAHFECFSVSTNIVDNNTNYTNQTTETIVSTELSTDYLSENSSFQNTPSCYSSIDIKKTDFIKGNVETPVNQILPKENFNKNGFNNKNIKQTHQEFKSRHFSDDNFNFDVSICPQFYKIDLLETSNILSLPYVINLTNKIFFAESENNIIDAMLQENSNLNSELLIKKEITKEFGFYFSNFFRILENFTFKPEDIVIDMIDIIDISTDGKVFKTYIAIIISKIGYLVLISVETNHGFSIDLKFLYKVMRFDDFVLIYLKSLSYPEIYFKIPLLKTYGSIKDGKNVLDKWLKVLNWKIQKLSISYNLQLLSSNLFAISSSDFSNKPLTEFLVFFLNKIPGGIAEKETDIIIKKEFDFDYLMPTKPTDIGFSGFNDNIPMTFCKNDDDLRIVCLVINTYHDIHETIKILLQKLETNCQIGFIVANGDTSFKYMGFVDSKWDGLGEFLETLFIEKNMISLKSCNLDNMFIKIDQLLKLKEVALSDYIDIKIFNDQEIGTEVKYFKKIVKKYSNLTIYNYDINLKSAKFETFMEENFQFSNNYSRLPFKKLDNISNKVILNQCQNNQNVCLNILINPDFQDCVSIKTFENTFGHKVIVENYKNTKHLQIKLKNEIEFKLIIIDLEIIDVQKFIQKIQGIENLSSNKKNSLMFYKINNAANIYQSEAICFNIIQHNSALEDTAIKNLKLSSEIESDDFQSSYDSDVSSATTELLISTPISSNKEPFYLLRDIELQLITILEEVLLDDSKKNMIGEKANIINYYYTVFFSYTKYIDIKDHGTNNFAYENINDFIDCLFEILLSNDQTKIALVYNMLKYQNRNDIKLLMG